MFDLLDQTSIILHQTNGRTADIFLSSAHMHFLTSNFFSFLSVSTGFINICLDLLNRCVIEDQSRKRKDDVFILISLIMFTERKNMSKFVDNHDIASMINNSRNFEKQVLLVRNELAALKDEEFSYIERKRKITCESTWNQSIDCLWKTN